MYYLRKYPVIPFIEMRSVRECMKAVGKKLLTVARVWISAIEL